MAGVRGSLGNRSIEDKTPPILTDPISRDEHPWDYPLEQMAQSCVLSYANETEER